MKKVSIVIPTYNRLKYLLECIRSIIQTEYRNKEVIIIDDCSTAENILSPDRGNILIDGVKIIFHKNKKNMGLSYNRNKGIELATGEYIKFMDDDDKLIYGALKKQIDYLASHPEVDAVYSEVNEDLCSGCRFCNDLCPYSAIEFNEEEGHSYVISALCKACGVCVAACPSAAIKGRHFTDEQVLAQIDGLFSEVEYELKEIKY